MSLNHLAAFVQRPIWGKMRLVWIGLVTLWDFLRVDLGLIDFRGVMKVQRPLDTFQSHPCVGGRRGCNAAYGACLSEFSEANLGLQVDGSSKFPDQKLEG